MLKRFIVSFCMACIVFAIAALVVNAAPTPPKFPMVFTNDGMSVTITHAAWQNMPSMEGGWKSLQIDYKVTGDNTVPFKITDDNTECAWIHPNGDSFFFNPCTYGNAGDGDASPLWQSVGLDFRAAAYAQQTLQWSSVPGPQKLDTPVTLGLKQRMADGAIVMLDKIMVRSVTPNTTPDETLILVFHIDPSRAASNKNITFMPDITVTSDSAAMPGALSSPGMTTEPEDVDTTTGAKGYWTYEIPFYPNGKLTTLGISLTLRESPKSLTGVRAVRDVRVAIPLAGLAGAEANGPDKSLAHVAAGPLETTLEYLTSNGPSSPTMSGWKAKLWLKAPVDGRTYALTQFDVATDTGTDLTPNGVGSNSTSFWKANGAMPSPGESPFEYNFTLQHGFPADAKSLTITTSASAETQRSARFTFTGIPAPAPGTTVQVNATATESIDPAATNSPGDSLPEKMTLTRVQIDANRQMKIYFRMSNDSFDPALRFVRPRSITDDQGRSVNVGRWGNSSGTDDGTPYGVLSVAAPQPDAKTLDIDLQVHDTKQFGDPVKVVFSGVPIPAAMRLAQGPLNHPVPPPVPTYPPLPASAPVADAAQDASGKVWAIMAPHEDTDHPIQYTQTSIGWQDPTGYIWPKGQYPPPYRMNDTTHLYSWNGSGWTPEPVPSGVNTSPARLTTSPAGAVVCAWGSDAAGYAFTLESGSTTRVLGGCGPIAMSLLLADSDNVWIVSTRGDFDRIDMTTGRPAQTESEYQVKVDEYLPTFQRAADGSPTYKFQWDGVVDSTGKAWFYTTALRDAYDSFRGVLEWNGHKMVAYPSLIGLPDGPIDSVSVLDATHLAVAAHNHGLYTVDTGTMSAGSEDESVRYAQCLMHSGGDIYLVSGFGVSIPVVGMPFGRDGTVYRWDGRSWQPIIVGVDSPNLYRLRTSRAMVTTDDGTIIGTNGYGAWFIPRSGDAPKHLDYRYQFPLPTVDRLFHVPQSLGGVLAIALADNDNRISSTVTHVEALTAAEPGKSLPTLSPAHGFVQDSKKHIWGFFAQTPRAHAWNVAPAASLQEWDTTKWVAHQAPAGLSSKSLGWIMLDSKGRIWLGSWQQAPTPSVYIFTPATGQWQSYLDYETALAAAGQEIAASPKTPVLTFPYYNSTYSPVFAPDGRVVYLGWNNTPIHYFDGSSWQTWSRPQITGVPRDGFAFDGVPFFDKNGTLCVNVNQGPFDRPRLGKLVTDGNDAAQRTTFRYTVAGGWKEGPYQEGPHDIWAQMDALNKRGSQFPKGLGAFDPGSLAVDAAGDYWTTSKGMLYRLHNGVLSPMIPADYANPFIDGRRVGKVLLDGAGTAFADTDSGTYDEWIMIPISPASTVAASAAH